ncbi:hypothetical protein [Halovivax gelatinilyticus]|nr:hypothetical protein [Halovivax gelatinilyticus]
MSDGPDGLSHLSWLTTGLTGGRLALYLGLPARSRKGFYDPLDCFT